MTDDHDEEAAGVPMRSERVDSEAHVTESGRHITNRNVVPRGTGDSGLLRRPAGHAGHAEMTHDAFDVVTPATPQPHAIDAFEVVTPAAVPAPVLPASHRTRTGFLPGMQMPPAASPPVAGVPVASAAWQPAAGRPARAASPDGARAAASEPAAGEAERLATERTRKPRPASELAHAPVALDRALRIIAIVAVFGLGAAGLAQPTSVLRGGIAWLAFLFFVLAGWGTITVRVARVADPDAGQRAALGIAGYLAVAGPLVALGVLSRPVILFLICIGFAGFAWREATAKLALWHRIRDGLMLVRGNPALGALIVVVVGFACVRLVGAVALLDRNPWDDDLAYTPLVKRLLDTGNLIEPFSFRRLASYGGQNVLQVLGAARGSLANVHLVDRGLGLGLLLLVTTGYARERRTQPVWLALIVLVVLLLPETAINTASYWIGAVGFFALYRCVAREQWALVGLTGAAICTLRQNFLVPVVALVAIVLVGRLITLARTMPRREAWLYDRLAWARVTAVALTVIVWWWIAAYRSSHTFLFPMFDGTWNHALSITPAFTTWTDELAFLVTCCFETAPFAVLPILAVVLAFVTDRRLGRPLSSLVLASLLGIGFLVHGLVGSEALHVWRYGFGFIAVLVVVLVLELGADDDARVSLAPLGRWIVLAALVLQLALGRGPLVKQVLALFGDIREAAAIDRQGDPSARAEQRRYTAMQAAMPVGARVLVMLDEPALLDFRRNQIANLDTPGFASPGTQLPMFAGAEPLRAYLVAEGYRYAAFVRSERSRYFFRRVFWVERMFTDIELLQTMSAYTLDAIDSFSELATTTPRLYDADGLVVLDLAHPTRPASTRVVAGDEPTRRGAWVRALADREGAHAAWSLNTRADLRFEDGVGTLRYTDDSIDDPQWYEISHARSAATGPGKPIRPAQRRVHLRVRGTTDMRLTLRAAVALNTVFTHPRLDVSLDGELVASSVADAAGRYAVDLVVPRARLAGGWRDLYLVFSSVADPATDVRDLRIARLESVEWAPP